MDMYEIWNISINFIFDNISPGVTINSAGAGCFSLNCTPGYTGTFTFENNTIAVIDSVSVVVIYVVLS